jgi:phosphopantothenate synthetase
MGNINIFHRTARRKWLANKIKKTGTSNQYLAVEKAVLKSFHFSGGIW